MATTVDWGNKIINVLRADMLLVQASPEIRQLDIDEFRLDLKALEAAAEGMPFLDTHSHNTTVTVGGVTLARVVEIINGYTVTFEDGQYAVNLVGANSNIADVTNVNQVSVRSANSAGLTYSDAINKQSFQGGFVYIDPENGLPGIQFPRGTPSDPSNNFSDAITIGQNNGYDNFNLDGVLVADSGANMNFQSWEGEGRTHSDLQFVENTIKGVRIERMALRGACVQNNEGFFRDCLFDGTTGVVGTMKDCQFAGVLTMGSGYSGIFSILNGSSHVAGVGSPVFNFNNCLADGEFRGYIGGALIKNFGQGKNLSIDMVAGHVILDSSCTSGSVLIRGNCKVTDNTTGAGITVNTDHVINSQAQSIKRDTALIPATL